jgi:LysR family transcriptional regulator, nitrogen assimilation regulatory protein
MNKELRSWRFLVKVAEVGSVTRAAEQLHMTQPALSRHLLQLEESTGVKLLMRHGRGVRLTPAGEHFRNVAEEILERMTSLGDELSARASEPSGEFAVGLPMSWAGLVTAELVPRFLRAFPKVKLRIVEGATPDLRRALNARQLQMAVMLDSEQDADLVLESLVDECAYLVGNKSSGIATGKRASFRVLAGQPLIQLPHETHVRVQVERALAKLRIQGDTLIEINSLNLLGFVERGLGVSVLPASAVESYPRKQALSYTLMRDFTFSWCIATLRSRPRTAAMNEFAIVLKQLLGDIVGRGLWPSARCTWVR